MPACKVLLLCIISISQSINNQSCCVGTLYINGSLLRSTCDESRDGKNNFFYISFAEIFCICDLSKGLHNLVQLFNNIYSLDFNVSLDDLHVIYTPSFAGQLV